MPAGIFIASVSKLQVHGANQARTNERSPVKLLVGVPGRLRVISASLRIGSACNDQATTLSCFLPLSPQPLLLASLYDL